MLIQQGSKLDSHSLMRAVRLLAIRRKSSVSFESQGRKKDFQNIDNDMHAIDLIVELLESTGSLESETYCDDSDSVSASIL